MSLAENKEIIRQTIEQVWNAHNPDAVDRLLPEDFVNRDPSQPDIKTRADFKQWASQVCAAFPDFHITIDEMIAEGDKAVTAWTVHGTHESAYKGIPATGRSIALPGITINRIQDGKNVEVLWSSDTMILLQQLGIVPVPA